MSQPRLHFRKALTAPGYDELVSPMCAPLEHITLAVSRMREGQTQRFKAEGYEAAIVLLNGRLTVSGDAIRQPAYFERQSVFKEPASTLYLAPGDEITLRAQSATEIAVAQAPSDTAGQRRTRIILPVDLRRREVGKDNWCRTVYDIIPGDFAADKLIVGETFNPPGNWSSSPPHKHDRHNPPRESKFEEVYFYRFDPPQGFALQRVYSAERDLNICYAVEHNDVVVLPRGYHPVVAAPGYQLYYLWILAGHSREPVWFEDPAHSWIHNSHHQSKANAQ